MKDKFWDLDAKIAREITKLSVESGKTPPKYHQDIREAMKIIDALGVPVVIQGIPGRWWICKFGVGVHEKAPTLPEAICKNALIFMMNRRKNAT